MPTKFPEIFSALAEKFEQSEIKVRTQAGRQLCYITARVVMNRLDNVLGAENWWDSYAPGENSVQCALTIRLPDGSTLTKCDAGGYAGMSDQGDDDKSGYSDSFKRAAVKFGIGRYLYRDGVPNFEVDSHEKSPASQKAPSPPAVKKPKVDGLTYHDWSGSYLRWGNNSFVEKRRAEDPAFPADFTLLSRATLDAFLLDQGIQEEMIKAPSRRIKGGEVTGHVARLFESDLENAEWCEAQAKELFLIVAEQVTHRRGVQTADVA